jgi:hypothetical protein
MAEQIEQTDKKTSLVKKRGWSGKNIFLGLGLLFVGFIIWFADSAVVGIASGVSGKKIPIGFWGDFGFALMAFGVLGYWLAIPAVQKWWNTKRWLSWTFLIPCVLLGIFILIAIFRS